MTEKKEEIHTSCGDLETCLDLAYKFSSELNKSKVPNKVNKYYFNDGITHKGYKVIPFDSFTEIKIFKIN
jgi:hypothetical protein